MKRILYIVIGKAFTTMHFWLPIAVVLALIFFFA